VTAVAKMNTVQFKTGQPKRKGVGKQYKKKDEKGRQKGGRWHIVGEGKKFFPLSRTGKNDGGKSHVGRKRKKKR